MELKRFLLDELHHWAQSKDRKPLLLQGARQTGKTWLLKTLGKTAFKYLCYIDFAKSTQWIELFKRTRDPKIILETIRAVSDVPIEPNNTLIVFDEIQFCESAFGALKYFAEEYPEYAIAASGSLLGLAIKKKSIFVPVGFVDIKEVTPLSFAEFLFNTSPKIYSFIESFTDLTSGLPEVITTKLIYEFRRYQCVGGLPAIVSALLDGTAMTTIDEKIRNLLNLYVYDFSQYTTPAEANRIGLLWNSLPSQLAKENKRFFFSSISKNARSREYLAAEQWLATAGLVIPVTRVSSARIPLAAYKETEFFKLYLFDIGLLRVMSKMSVETVLTESQNYKEFKGALTENCVAISLARALGYPPNYWASGNRAEVDFLIEVGNNVCPIEVKAGTSVRARSLSVFAEKFSPQLSVRFSMLPLSLKGHLLNIPLPLTDWSLKWIKQSLST